VKFEAIQFLTVVLDASDGAPGTRDRGLLDSAVMAPQSGYYVSLAEMAAVYAHGIAKNHAFVDGNKRTALVSSLAFLRLNGYPLRVNQAEWQT
jgi:death on curing protein